MFIGFSKIHAKLVFFPQTAKTLAVYFARMRK